MAITWHLTTRTVWQEQQGEDEYRPAAFAADGFIHCTDDIDRLMETGNTYYRSDNSRFLAIEIELDALSCPWLYEDPDQVFPHIYGSLNQGAVVSIRLVIRSASGEFLRVGDRNDAH